MSRVTEGIFEYPKQVTEWARNGSKNQIFARARRVQFETLRRSHGIMRIILRPLIAVGAAGLQKKDVISAFSVIFPW
jgi:hypothetical protein